MIFRLIYILSILTFCVLGSREKGSSREYSTEICNDQHILNQDVEIIGLLYHRFGEPRYPSTSINRELFREQLNYLANNGFRVITFSDAIKILTSPGAKGRYVTITIDDAFNSFLENGWPVLKEFGYQATLFVNTETVGSGDYLDWNELVQLSEEGIEIGNHTHSHDYYLNMDPASRLTVFRREVLMAQRIIRERLGVEPIVFAYPYGEYDQNMKEEIQNLGFLGAAAQNSGVISHYADQFALPRFPMTDLYGKMTAFKEKLSTKPLPVIGVDPLSTIATTNPPVLKIILEEAELNYEEMQCFIQGGDCRIISSRNTRHSYEITSVKPLNSRRHLYTVTMPDKSHTNWYWFSFQWVFPEKE